MKLTPQTNVISLFAGTIEKAPRKPGLSAKPRDRRADRRVGLLEQLKRQTEDYERAIHDTESARLSLDVAASGAAEALIRFERTLDNLRLSLHNHREACQRIESAQRAGEAAALVSAQILGDGSLALSCYGEATELVVRSLLDDVSGR